MPVYRGYGSSAASVFVDVASGSTSGTKLASGPDAQVLMQTLIDASPAGAKFLIRPGIWDLLKPLQAPNPSFIEGCGMMTRQGSSSQQPDRATLRIMTAAIDADWNTRGIITDKAFLTGGGTSPVVGITVRDIHLDGNGTTVRRRGNGIIASSAPFVAEHVSIVGLTGNTAFTAVPAGDGYGIIMSAYKSNGGVMTGNFTQPRLRHINIESKQGCILTADDLGGGTGSWSDGVMEDIYTQADIDSTVLNNTPRIELQHASGWFINKIQTNGSVGGHALKLRTPDHTRITDLHIDGWGGGETAANRVSAVSLSNFSVGATNQTGTTTIENAMFRWREEMTSNQPTYVGLEIIGTGNATGPWRVYANHLRGIMRNDNLGTTGFSFPHKAFAFSIRKSATAGTDITLVLDGCEFLDNQNPPQPFNDSQIFEVNRNATPDFRTTAPPIFIESHLCNWQRRAAAPALAAVNQVQSISPGNRTGGTFKLEFCGQVTSALQWNDTAANIQTALRALTNTGGTTVTCAGGPVGNPSVTPVTCTFSGALAALQLQVMELNTDLLTGGTTSPAVTVTTPGVSIGTYPMNTEFNKDPQVAATSTGWMTTAENPNVYTAKATL